MRNGSTISPQVRRKAKFYKNPFLDSEIVRLLTTKKIDGSYPSPVEVAECLGMSYVPFSIKYKEVIESVKETKQSKVATTKIAIQHEALARELLLQAINGDIPFRDIPEKLSITRSAFYKRYAYLLKELGII